MTKNKKIVGSITILIIFTLIVLVGYKVSTPSKTDDKEIFTEELIDKTNEKSNDKEFITIYINGEVKNPGLYKLKDGSRIGDALKLSGGFTKNAYKKNLNLAKKIKDEDHIYVENIESSECSKGSTNKKSNKINVNTASKEELQSVSGIGEVTATKIIEYRNDNGKFKTLDDLKKIDRIGEKTFNKFKEKLIVR